MVLRAIPTEQAETSANKATDGVLDPELFRQLFVSLGVDPVTSPVIGVTSAIAGEGRTTVAEGLARVLATDLDSVVTLVDADLDHPSLADRFATEQVSGLTEILRGQATLRTAGFMASDNLYVVPSGPQEFDEVNLLRQLAVGDLFHISPSFEGMQVVDLPPLLEHAYSGLLAQATDALVLVVRAGVTPIDMIREAMARLEVRQPDGIVLNGAHTSHQWATPLGVTRSLRRKLRSRS